MKEKPDNGSGPLCEYDPIPPLVLVVDDEPFMRQIFREPLEEFGCRVVEACGGEEALHVFREFRPDVLILDLVMPGMDGFETCVAIRSLKEGMHTPILAVTGLRDTAAIHQAFKAGATDFISKPVNAELLGYRIQYLLRAGKALEDLARSEANLRLLRVAVESLPIGITISDAEGKIIYTNPAEAAMHGYEVEELLYQEARILAPQSLCPDPSNGTGEYGIWQRESVNCRKDGKLFPVHLSSVAVRSPQGEFLGIVTACENITERKRNEEKIHNLAYYDSLTGLPNRALFLNHLQKALAKAERSKNPVAVLFLDLDNFKDINDAQGHDFGDMLLKEVAARLSECIRTSDTLARLGGDEFVIVMSGADRQNAAGVTALRILQTFRSPFEVHGRRTYAGISIGIALYPDDSSDLEALLRSADTAMYKAKEQGRHNFRFFSEKMGREIVEKVALESALWKALEGRELCLLYQPQWDLRDEYPCGMEVLVRWRHPEFGTIPPKQFIPLAESSGQIFRLGEWVLRTACAQATTWAEKGCPVERLAVNVSGHQLRQPDFPDLIGSILTETNFPPSNLELEFTESVLLEHAGPTAEVLRELRKMGIQLSIDDFGTGYSSLSYLKHFPVDRIKIDKAFIAGIGGGSGDAAIVEAILALAASLNIKVLAEGVETNEQLEFLQAHGCSEAQGFFLSEPLSAAEMGRLLEVRRKPRKYRA